MFQTLRNLISSVQQKPADVPEQATLTPPVDEQADPTLSGQSSPPDTTSADDAPAWKSWTPEQKRAAAAALLDDEDVPLDVVTTHQKVSGHIGTLAKRQARELRAQEDQSARDQRLRDLAARGQYTELGQEVAGGIVPDPAAELHTSVASALTGSAKKELGTLLATLPEASAKKLSDRAQDGAYNGPFGEGLKVWVGDLAAEMVAAQLPAAIEKEIQKRGLVPRAVAEAERVAGQGSPDVRRGGSAGAPNWETEGEMAAALADGLASGDPQARAQMTTWYRSHRRR